MAQPTTSVSEQEVEIPVNYEAKYVGILDLINSTPDPTTILAELSKTIAEIFDGTIAPAHRAHLIEVFLPKAARVLLRYQYTHDEIYYAINRFLQLVLDVVVFALPLDSPGAIDALRRVFDGARAYYHSQMQRNHLEAESHMDPNGERFADMIGRTSVWGSRLCVANINHFGRIGGFKAIAARIARTAPKCPLSLVAGMLNAIVQVQDLYLRRDKLKEIMDELAPIVSDYVTNLTDDELRLANDEDLSAVIFDLEDLLDGLWSDEDAGKLCEGLYLTVALRCFRSANLKKRIHGLSCMREATIMLARRGFAVRCQGNHYRAAKWMTIKQLMGWFREHQVLEMLFGATKHAELLKRSSEVIRFVLKNGDLTLDDMELLWQCAVSSHEIYRDAVFKDIFGLLCYALPDEHVEFLFKKIAAWPREQIDVHMLELAKTLTQKKTPAQLPLLHWMGVLVLDDGPHCPATELCLDVLTCLQEAWKSYVVEAYRDAEMVRIVQCVLHNQSVVCALRLLSAIIATFTEYRTMHRLAQRETVARLQHEYDLVGVLVQNFMVFKVIAHANYDAMSPEDLASFNVNTTVVSGRMPYITEINERLRFIRSVFDHVRSSLTCKQVEMLWDCLVTRALAPAEADALLLWFHDQLSPLGSLLLDDAATRRVRELLFSIQPDALTLVGLRCLVRYTTVVWVRDGGLSWVGGDDTGEGVGVGGGGIGGLQPVRTSFEFETTSPADPELSMHLWEIILRTSSPEVVSEATAFLVKLYESPSERLRQNPYGNLKVVRHVALDAVYSRLRKAEPTDVTVIQRCLALLKALFAKCDADGGVRPKSHGLSARGRPLVVRFTNTIQSAQPPDMFTISAHSNETLGALRQRCLAALPHVKAAESVVLRTNGQELTDLTQTLQELQFEDQQTIVVSSSKEGVATAAAAAQTRTSPARPPPQPLPPPVVAFPDPHNGAEIAAQLMESCGCTHEAATATLRRCNWDINEAATLLLDGGGDLGAGMGAPPMDFGAPPPPPSNEVPDDSTSLYPSMLLSSNQTFMDHLFQLLTVCTPVASQVWDLLMAIPTNRVVLLELHELSLGDAPGTTSWAELFNTESAYKLLYSLQIVDTLLFPMNAEENLAERVKWGRKFMAQGGFEHFYAIITSDAFAPARVLGNVQHTQCLALLLKVVEFFMRGALRAAAPQPYQPASADAANSFDTKIRQMASAVGPSMLGCVRLGEFLPRLLTLTLAAASRAEISSDDCDVVAYAMRLVVVCVASEPQLFRLVAEFPAEGGAPEMLRRVLMRCPEKVVRSEVGEALYGLCCSVNQPVGEYSLPRLYYLALLVNELPAQDEQNALLAQYFGLLCRLINDAALFGGADASYLRPLLLKVVASIKARRTVEVDNKHTDQVLVGFLRLARTILSHAPVLWRLELGSQGEGRMALVSDIYAACLFATATPTEVCGSGVPLPPKCKSPAAREAAFSLLVELCRGCAENMDELLQLLRPHHTGAVSVSGWDYYPGADARSATGYVGLQNMGCTCYINSLVQQMYMMPRLRRGVLSIEEGAGEGGGKARAENVVWQIQAIMGYLQESARKAYVPDGFMRAYKDWEGQPINVVVQQDVDEFFNLLCQRVEEHLKGSQHAALLATQFGGKLSNVIRSLETEFPYYGERPEDFFRLSLDIKGKATLTEALDFFCKADVMEGDNAYHCEEFNRKITASKGCMIHSMSDTLILHLKRFEFDLQTMERTKLHDQMSFPPFINMLPWTREGLARKHKDTDKATAAAQELPLRPDWYYEYQLVGVLVHQGEAQGGHYYSYIRRRESTIEHDQDFDPNATKFSGAWFEFNDSEVSAFNPERLPQECFGGMQIVTQWHQYRRHWERSFPRTRSAYMLFYQRPTPAPPDWVDPLAPPAPTEDSTVRPRTPSATPALDDSGTVRPRTPSSGPAGAGEDSPPPRPRTPSSTAMSGSETGSRPRTPSAAGGDNAAGRPRTKSATMPTGAPPVPDAAAPVVVPGAEGQTNEGAVPAVPSTTANTNTTTNDSTQTAAAEATASSSTSAANASTDESAKAGTGAVAAGQQQQAEVIKEAPAPTPAAVNKDTEQPMPEDKTTVVATTLTPSASTTAVAAIKGVPAAIYEAAWRENVNFTRDRYLFDSEYFSFMLSFAKAVPFADVWTEETDTATDRGYAIITLGTAFCFEVLIHARVSDMLEPWFTFLCAAVERHLPAARWVLEYSIDWIKETMLECPREDVRHNVCALMGATLRTVGPRERDRMKQNEKVQGRQTAAAAAAGHPPPMITRAVALSVRFFERLLELLEPSRVYWRQFRQYFSLFREYASLGYRERLVMVDHDVFDLFIDYYMGASRSGQRRVDIMDQFQSPDLTEFFWTLQVLFCGCKMGDDRIDNPRTLILTSLLEPTNNMICILPPQTKVIALRVDFWQSMLSMGYNLEATRLMVQHLIWHDEQKSQWIIRLLVNSIKRENGVLTTLLEALRDVLLMEDGPEYEQLRARLALAREGREDHHMGILTILWSWMRSLPMQQMTMQIVRWLLSAINEVPSVRQFMESPTQRQYLLAIDEFIDRRIKNLTGGRSQAAVDTFTAEAQGLIVDILKRTTPVEVETDAAAPEELVPNSDGENRTPTGPLTLDVHGVGRLQDSQEVDDGCETPMAGDYENSGDSPTADTPTMMDWQQGTDTHGGASYPDDQRDEIYEDDNPPYP